MILVTVGFVPGPPGSRKEKAIKILGITSGGHFLSQVTELRRDLRDLIFEFGDKDKATRFLQGAYGLGISWSHVETDEIPL